MNVLDTCQKVESLILTLQGQKLVNERDFRDMVIQHNSTYGHTQWAANMVKSIASYNAEERKYYVDMDLEFHALIGLGLSTIKGLKRNNTFLEGGFICKDWDKKPAPSWIN